MRLFRAPRLTSRCAACRPAPSHLQSLAAGDPLGVAAASPLAANTHFDLAANLAALFAGLAIDITNDPFEVPLP
jgi:hypothetical protein